jgi:NADH:ubiquinone oxidoreductase subunit 5 (subunit L)/multisubunit Na+/H+ antiporter MnhA subunit
MFAGISRLLVAVPEDALGWGIRSGVWLAGFGLGWVLLRLFRGASTLMDRESRSTAWTLEVLPMGLAVACLLLGIVGLPLHGIEFWGGSAGIPGGVGFAVAGILGWLASALAARRARRPAGRWTSTDWAFMHVAETGLGIGELVVQLPLMLVRALGVVVWRVVGDWIVDGLVLGLAVRTVEGVGLSLRYLQNGRVQRYLWVALTAALMLVWMLVRE